MTRRCFLFCLVAFLFCRAPLAPARAAVAAPVTLAQLRLGEQTLAILRGATRVETFRVGVPPPFGQADTGARIDGRLLSTVGPAQGRPFAARLFAVLLDPRLYPSMRDRCLFDPGILLRAWRGRECVDCLLCFHCDDVLILTHDAQGRQTHLAFTHFGPLRPQMLALAKLALPADQEIQALPEK